MPADPVPLSAAEHVLWDLWIAAFAARRDVFVVDSRLTVRESLDVQLCARAAKLGHSISGYLAAPFEDQPGMWTTMGAIDVDTDVDDALAIRHTLEQHSIPTLMALSRRGAHLWMWTVGDGIGGTERYMPVPAPKVRQALEAAVVLTIADKEKQAHIEVFPKVARQPLGVGTLRMPLFKHPKTGLTYPVVGMDGHETADRLAAYRAIPADSPYEAVRRLAVAVRRPVRYPVRMGTQTAPAAVVEGPGVTALLSAMGVPTPLPGKSVRCPFHEDRHASLSIADDDQRVFCKAPACPIHNGGRGLGSLALAKLVKR